MRKNPLFSIILGLVLLSVSCTNPLRTAVENETAAVKASDSTVSSFTACIDTKSEITIRFEKSTAPETLVMSGSMAKDVAKITWSKTALENDTLVLTPDGSWSADPTAGGTTGSLAIEVKDTEGWPCKKLEWRPEILDHVIYVNADRGEDSDAGSGSAGKPFKSLRYAMRAKKLLYPDSVAEIHLASGDYDTNTDDGTLRIDSSLSILGGYSPENWDDRDTSKYITTIGSQNPIISTVLIASDDNSVSIDGLTINEATYTSSKYRLCVNIYVDGASSLTIKDCRLVNSPRDQTYTCVAVFADEKSTINVIDSVIEMNDVGKFPRGFDVYGSLRVSNCRLLINQSVFSSNVCYGVWARSSTIIENSEIDISGGSTGSFFTGIFLDASENNIEGHISDCSISIGSSLWFSEFLTGIRLEGINAGFSVERNMIDIRGGAKSATGLELRAANGIALLNNVIRGGEGDTVTCIDANSSRDIIIENNTLYMGSAAYAKAEVAFGYGARLSDNSKVQFSANILFGDRRNFDKKFFREGIFCPDDGTTVDLEGNVFCGINEDILYLSPSCNFASDETGLQALNMYYGNSYPNQLFASAAELALTNIDDWHTDGLLVPTSSTPLSIVRSKMDSAPLVDALGKLRTKPYSIGAYEYDN